MSHRFFRDFYLCTIVLPGYAYTKSIEETADESKSVVPKFFIQAFKALDYGSGQERGARR
jgi:hypothetical protein